jgi:hypothetical protein
LGKVVEIDETFIGQKKDVPKRRGYAHKHAVMTLIERGSKGGNSRWFHVKGTKASDLLPIFEVAPIRWTAMRLLAGDRVDQQENRSCKLPRPVRAGKR